MNTSAVSRPILAAALLLAPIQAAGAADGLQAMIDDLTKVESDLKQIPSKIQENLALKKQHEAELAPIDAAWDQLKSVKAELDAQAPTVDSQCNRTVPKEQLEAAHAQCQAVLNPYNAKVDAYNARRESLDSQEAPIRAAEQERVAKAQAIKQEYDSLTQREASLKSAIRAAMLAKCPQALTGSDENVAQSASRCFDGAAASSSTVTGGPTFSMTPNRTPEQAIQDYKNSGRKPGPNTLKINEPPPPPK